MDSDGAWISSIRIERMINAHPKVRASAVITSNEGARGEQLLAIVEPMAREQLSSRDVIEFLRAQLPATQVPDGVILVMELPRTREGMPDRCCLRAMYASGGAAGAH